MSDAEPPPVAVDDPATLEARVALLEAFVARGLTGPAVKANPPITIGPFTNVPAPGSPIRSDWPQSISDFVNKLRGDALVGTASLVVAPITASSRPWQVAGTYAATTTAGGAFTIPFGFTTNGGVLGWTASSGDGAAWLGFAVRSSITASGLTIAVLSHDGSFRVNAAIRADFVITGWNNT